MLKDFDFDKDSFLRQGALFGKNGEIWLLWGEPHETFRRPEAVAIMSMDFHQTETPAWLLFPYAVNVSQAEAQKLFQASKTTRKFHEASFDHFQTQFKMIQKGFDQEEIEKVVPYVFEKSDGTFSLVEREGAIHSLLKQSQGFIYGLWNGQEGCLGLTPEILISQKK